MRSNYKIKTSWYLFRDGCHLLEWRSIYLCSRDGRQRQRILRSTNGYQHHVSTNRVKKLVVSRFKECGSFELQLPSLWFVCRPSSVWRNWINRRKLLKLVTWNCLRAKENRVELARSFEVKISDWSDKSGKNGS